MITFLDFSTNQREFAGKKSTTLGGHSSEYTTERGVGENRGHTREYTANSTTLAHFFWLVYKTQTHLTNSLQIFQVFLGQIQSSTSFCCSSPRASPSLDELQICCGPILPSPIVAIDNTVPCTANLAVRDRYPP